MSVGLLGRKIGMTQVYGEDGGIIPVTVIELGPCPVLQVKTPDRDGYSAVQLGFDDKRRRCALRSERGHVVNLGSKRQKAREAAQKVLEAVATRKGRETPKVEIPAKANCEAKRFVREFRTDGEDHGCTVGQALTVSLFTDVPSVDVIGITKGRGTTGVMKRHNFSGQRASHGVKRVHRHPGSIGASADPSRVVKGMRMAGHYGTERVTIRNLKVVRVDHENNMLLVRGAVPGPNGGYLMVRRTNKQK